MTLTLTMNLDNAAFDEGYAGFESARILIALANQLEKVDDITGFECPLMDINGNRVGNVTIAETHTQPAASNAVNRP